MCFGNFICVDLLLTRLHPVPPKKIELLWKTFCKYDREGAGIIVSLSFHYLVEKLY